MPMRDLPTDDEIDASIERARAFIKSMPVDPEQSDKLVAAMVAMIQAAPSRPEAAQAFAAAASGLTGGKALVTILYGDRDGYREIFGPEGALAMMGEGEGEALH